MAIGDRAIKEARTLGGEALLLGSYKNLGLRIGAAVALHAFGATIAILLVLHLSVAAPCETGCFRPGLEFCCLGNTTVLSTWGVVLIFLGLSSWVSTRFLSARDFGRSAAVTALCVVCAVIYFGVVGYSLVQLSLIAVVIFCASYLGFRLAY